MGLVLRGNTGAEMDISDNKIKKIEASFRTLFNNPTDVIWILDLNTFRFKYVSSEIEPILGYTPEETEQMSPQDLCTPTCLAIAMESLEKEAERLERGENRTVRISTTLINKDGEEVQAEVDWRLYKGQGSVNAIGILRDPACSPDLETTQTDLEREFQKLTAERDRLRWRVKVLEGLLPICANCRKIRDENGEWQDLEAYISERSEADFTHTICPTCKDEIYPELRGNK